MVLPTHSSPHLEQSSSRGAGLLRISGHGRRTKAQVATTTAVVPGTLSPKHGASMVPDTRRIGDNSRGKLGAKLHSTARPLLHDNCRPTQALPTEHDSSNVGFIQSSTVDNRSKQYTDHALGGHKPSKGVQRPGSGGQGRNNDHALSRDSFAKMTSSQTVLGEIQSQVDGLEESSSESYMSDSDMGASDPQSEEEMEVQTYTNPLHEGGSCTSPRHAIKLHKGMDFTLWKDKLKIVSATLKEKIPQVEQQMDDEYDLSSLMSGPRTKNVIKGLPLATMVRSNLMCFQGNTEAFSILNRDGVTLKPMLKASRRTSFYKTASLDFPAKHFPVSDVITRHQANWTHSNVGSQNAYIMGG